MRLLALCLAIFGAGCVRNAVVENRAPFAAPGPDQSVFGGHTVTLSGKASSDPEGDPLTFSWNQTAGVRVALVDAGSAVTSFDSPQVTRATTLVFQLLVNDGQLSNKASTSVTLNVPDPGNHAPVAHITAPATVQSGAMVELDGSLSSDSDGDSMTYEWSQSAGPALTLTNPDQARALFAAPVVVTADTLFAFKLVVKDGKGGLASARSSVLVQKMTTNRPPIASAGMNQNASAAASVTLQGSATDPDGDELARYQWTQTAGAKVTLLSPTIASPSFVAPTPSSSVALSFSLVVTDARGAASAPALVNVFVSTGAVTAAEFTKVVSLHAVTRTGIVLLFLTDVPVAASVDYATGFAGEQTVTEPQPATRHVIALTGLTADTRYRYAVRAGTASSSGSFTTAIDYAATARSFTFAVVGDARVHSEWKTVAASVLAKNPRFVVQTGDNNDAWGTASNWGDYYSSGKELFANVPVFAAQGNHDTGSNFSVYNLAPQSSSRSDLDYAFVYGNAGFVAINSNGSSRAMTSWVSTALARLSGGPLFAFQHHPLYSCGSHGSSTSMQSTYQKLFENNHVTTDYAGHDHALIVWNAINGVRYVVSGGGGAGLYPLRGCVGPYAQSKYGFLIVNVNGKTVDETLYDQHGEPLYDSGPFQAAGEAPDFKGLSELVAY